MTRTILQSRTLRTGVEIILAHLPENAATPFATWTRDSETGETYYGHYFDNEAEAIEDYQTRGEPDLGDLLYTDEESER